jgi:hypothetical protein
MRPFLLARIAISLVALAVAPTLAGATEFQSPTSTTCSSLTYRFAEHSIPPGDRLDFNIPARFRELAVAFATIGHRQRQDADEPVDPLSRDPFPGLTSLQLAPANPVDANAAQWRYWAGPSSGRDGAKFAEIRAEPESDYLYEWRLHGHRAVGAPRHSTPDFSALKIRAARLVNVGSDSILASELTLKFQPRLSKTWLQATFSPGTELGDPETAQGRILGGGQRFGGFFLDAIVLGTGRTPNHVPSNLPAGWSLRQGDLHIPLPAGQEIDLLEIACGDTHPDGLRNKDGGWGSLGAAKLTAVIKNVSAPDRSLSLMMRENVPSEGVLLGSPARCGEKTLEGDELILHADQDWAFVMAVRIGMTP